jgi:cation:H+ antiporter
MMVQATIPAALGLFFTPWHFSPPLIAASVATLGAIAYQLIVMRGKRFTPAWMMGTALFYVAFAVFLITGNSA